MTRLASLFGDGSAAIEVGFELAERRPTSRGPRPCSGPAHVVGVTAAGATVRRLAAHASAPRPRRASVRQAVLAAAVEHGLRLTALRPIVPSLDDIYRTALQRRGPPTASASGRGRPRVGGPPHDAPRPRPTRAPRPTTAEAVATAARARPAGGSSPRKEFGDHVLSVRFVVLLIVLGLAAAIPLYFAADRIRSLATAAVTPRERPARGLPRAVHARAAGHRDPARSTRSSRSSRRCSGWRSRSTPSTASAPRARCRACWPSRSTATTSSTASSPPAWRSSGWCSCRWCCSSRASGCSGSGSCPHGQEVVRLVAWVLATFLYVALWLAFGLLLSVAIRRAATSALVGFGVWLLFTIFGPLIVTLVSGVFTPGGRRDRRTRSSAAIQVQEFIQRLLPSKLYSEISTVDPPARTSPPISTPATHRPVRAGAAADPAAS